jgi:hypothetical protein
LDLRVHLPERTKSRPPDWRLYRGLVRSVRRSDRTGTSPIGRIATGRRQWRVSIGSTRAARRAGNQLAAGQEGGEVHAKNYSHAREVPYPLTNKPVKGSIDGNRRRGEPET